MCAAAWGNHNTIDVVSTGPAGGNGALSSQFRGASADGTRVIFQSSEPLVASDTDTRMDLYERTAGVTTLLSVGPNGGNGAFNAAFSAVSQNGSRVFFRTSEALVASDTDTTQDLYERASGVTSLISTGTTGAGGSAVIFDAISPDGSAVLFDTAEQLVASDTDTWRDVYRRAGGTTTLVSVGAGDSDALFAGASSDATRVFFTSEAPFAASDFDTMQDVYESTGGTVTHLSIGPVGGNGNEDFDYDTFFDGASADGSKVWMHTDEVLVAGDTDAAVDVYERAGAAISVVSTGPSGGNAEQGAFFNGASADGSRVFFDTQEQLTGSDSDPSTDIYERAGGATTLISTGPAGGNGTFFSAFQRATTDGSRVFFHTPEGLVAEDTDGMQDVYQRQGGTTTLISTGPLNANAPFPASFKGMSQTGTRVFFDTAANLVPHASGIYPDLYERESDVTTFLSSGPLGGNGDFFAFFAGASSDGSRVFFETDERLVTGDTDTSQDVYMSSITDHGGYPRPRGAANIRVPLVPAFSQCAAPNRTHGPSLTFPSCNPPAQASPHLTVGTPDANGTAANSSGEVKFNAIAGAPTTPADEGDVSIVASITDVRQQTTGLPDYLGQLQLDVTLRITDKLNGSAPIDQGTTSDLPFPVTVPCAPTAATTIGASCSVNTTADAVLPGVVRELKRTMWQMDRIALRDGGADGLAATTPNEVFATQGVLVP